MAPAAKDTAPAQTEETGLPPEDRSQDGWDTVRDESPTLIIFDEIGDQFTGTYRGPEVIHNPQDDEDFTRHNFQGLDSKPYAINNSYALEQAAAKFAVGDRVRLTYVKDIPSTRGNPLKDIKVEVKRT